MTIHAPLGPAYLVTWAPCQSNGLGQTGQAGSAPAVTAGRGIEVRYQTLINPLVEPFGAASTGSCAAAFLNAAYDGVPIFVVQAGVGGTCMLEVSEQITEVGWWDGGQLTDDAIYLTTVAYFALRNAGYAVRWQGSFMCQGEGDGTGYPGTAAQLLIDYEAGARDCFDRIKAGVAAAGIDTATSKMWISQTGTVTTGDTALYAAVRQAQTNLAANNDDIVMGSTSALSLVQGGQTVDTVHLNQTAQNQIGTEVGTVFKATCDDSSFDELGPQSIPKPMLAAFTSSGA